MSDLGQAVGSVFAILLAFALGWLLRETQFRARRAKMRRKRAANQRRKRRGQPKLGVTGSRTARSKQDRLREINQRIGWPQPKKPAKGAGLKLSMSAREWLDIPEDEPVSQDAGKPEPDEIDSWSDETLAEAMAEWTADEEQNLKMWRGGVTRKTPEGETIGTSSWGPTSPNEVDNGTDPAA